MLKSVESLASPGVEASTGNGNLKSACMEAGGCGCENPGCTQRNGGCHMCEDVPVHKLDKLVAVPSPHEACSALLKLL